MLKIKKFNDLYLFSYELLFYKINTLIVYYLIIIFIKQ
jgi:hypothetical protein